MADQNQLLNTGLPGPYGTAAVVQNILAQKRDDARQAMLESMAQRKQDLEEQNVQSQIADRNESAASQKEIREANAAMRAAQAGKITTDAANDKATQDYLKSYEANNPEAFKSLDPEDQRGIRFASGLPANHPLVNEMVKRIMTPNKVEKPVNGHVYFADESKGTLVDPVSHQPVPLNQITSADKIVNIPRPANIPQPTVTVAGQDTDGAALFTTNRFDKNNKPVLMRADGSPPLSGHIRPKDTAATDKPKPLYNEQAYNRFKTALGSTSPTAKDMRASAAQDLINSITNPAVQSDVRDIMGDPEMMRTPSSVLISSGRLTAPPGADDKAKADHFDKVKQVLSVLRPQVQ